MKKYYVNGGILIVTPFFKYAGAGAAFGADAIPGCEIISPTNRLPSGEEYLLIDDNHPQSMFAAYYAKTFFTTGYCWAPLFHKSYEDDYSEFCNKVQDAKKLSKLSCENEIDPDVSSLLMRHAFLTVLSALDTFIADTVLTRITNDEEAFYSFVRQTNNYKGCEKDIQDGKNGFAEQKVIEFVLSHSYLNKDSIKEAYLSLFDFSVTVNNTLTDLFRQRHLIAHRGGRQKDGNYIRYTKEEIDDAIIKVDAFAKAILTQIQLWEKSEGMSKKI